MIGRLWTFAPRGVAVAVWLAVAVAIGFVVDASARSAAGEVVQANGWTCSGPVDLDLVKITNPGGDAVTFAAGCTGTIRRLEVDTRQTDGVKIKQGAHDIVVGGGYVTCSGMRNGAHQDAVQAMAGQRILFTGVTFDCLGNSNFFVNDGAGSERPTDIVCDGCRFGPHSSTTVRVNVSLRSGARNSQACVGRNNRNAFLFTSSAQGPVNTGNTVLPATDAFCAR